ncbi:MAG: hypothetical protein IT454_19120 [Planctomycetes bacterium]|nr:hypothetical protein [Planctomycetota bacterium]
MTRTRLMLGAGLVIASFIAFASARTLLQDPAAEIIHDSRSTEILAPVDVSTLSMDQIVELMEAQSRGEPLPAGFVALGSQGRVKATLMDLYLPSGEQQLVVTVIDDSTDVQWAQLSIDDLVVHLATRANAGVIDRGSMGVATLVGYVSAATTSVDVEWMSSAGMLLSDRVESR